MNQRSGLDAPNTALREHNRRTIPINGSPPSLKLPGFARRVRRLDAPRFSLKRETGKRSRPGKTRLRFCWLKPGVSEIRISPLASHCCPRGRHCWFRPATIIFLRCPSLNPRESLNQPRQQKKIGHRRLLECVIRTTLISQMPHLRLRSSCRRSQSLSPPRLSPLRLVISIRRSRFSHRLRPSRSLPSGQRLRPPSRQSLQMNRRRCPAAMPRAGSQ